MSTKRMHIDIFDKTYERINKTKFQSLCGCAYIDYMKNIQINARKREGGREKSGTLARKQCMTMNSTQF